MLTTIAVSLPWRRLFLICLAATVLISAAQGQIPAIQKIQANGAYAEMRWSDWPLDFTLVVGRNDSSGETQTYVQYIITEIYWTHGTWITGGGQVDNKVLTGHETTSLQLLVDTTNRPEFNQQRCVYDFIEGTEACEPWSGGLIDLQWKRTNMFEEETVGRVRRTYWPVTWLETGKSITRSAKATGTLMGFQIDTDDWICRMGVQRSSTIEIQRMSSPPPRPSTPQQ